MSSSPRKRKGRQLPPKITDLREQGRPNAKKPYRAYWWNSFAQPPRKGGHATFATLPEAEKWIQDRERDNAAFYEGKQGAAMPSRSFEHVSNKWAETLRRSTSTCEHYRSHARQLQSYFGAHAPVAAISKDDVHGMLHQFLKVQGLTEGTVKARLNVLNQILDMAMDQGLRSDNPCRGLERPKERVHVPYTFTGDDVEAVLQQLPERYRMPVLLAYHSGLRIGEISALRTRDVKLDDRQLRIMGTRLESGQIQNHPKGGQPGERATIPDTIISELERYMKEYPPNPDGYVFTSVQFGGSVLPMPTSTLRKQFNKACLAAGLPADELRFHDLRHACATNYAKSEAPAYIIQGMLRHGLMSTSQRYIRPVSDDEARAWADRVARSGPTMS